MTNAFQAETGYEFVANLPHTQPAGRSAKRKPFVEALKSRPGEWAIYPLAKSESTKANSANATAWMLRRDFPGVETATRKGKLYARWIGKPAKGGVR